MTEQEILERTVEYVKAELKDAEGGHDWWHVVRVRRNAAAIARTEPASRFIVELGALLHDIADQKFHGGDETVGVKKARAFLEGLAVEEEVIRHVEMIIGHISFKGGNLPAGFSSPELSVVQDADRLDAMGAIGIARAFNYGGFKGRELYDPGIKPLAGMTAEQYKKSSAPTINHFHEKLLLLKDRMNTATGRKMAEERHRFMECYLEQFFKEWEG
jgi:uncharacterized protein